MKTKRCQNKLQIFACIAAATSCATMLTACGESSSISVAAVAKCAHAAPHSDTYLVAHTPSNHEVVAKTIKGGWLYQIYAEESPAESIPGKTEFELYIFKNDKTAEEAFNLISTAPNTKEEWGDGGSFRRGNVIADAEEYPGSSITAEAESLLNKCVGSGSTQTILRPNEEIINGRTRSEINRANEDGGDLPTTSTEGSEGTGSTSTGETGLPYQNQTEAPSEYQTEAPGESQPSQGQSPVPGETE